MSRLVTLIRRLRGETSGLAVTEFAFSMPFLMMAGLWAVELGNYAVTSMKVNQLAIQIADNASRIGETATLKGRKIYEADINDLLVGANIQSGHLDLFENGRVIVSSLEVYREEDHCDSSGGACVPSSANEDDQFIHWQRCLGKKSVGPDHGDVDDVMPNGIGPAGREVEAFPGDAVIFVELKYDYQPLVSSRFVGTPEIKAIASFMVRDSRDLYAIYQTASPSPEADCAVFDNPYGPGGVPPPA